MAKKVTGTTKFIDLEGGIWAIMTTQGNFAPLNFPEQLRTEGKKVSCTLKELDVMTLHNWGIPCEIISFSTFDSNPVWNS